LITAVKAIIRDAQLNDWTTEQYAILIGRSVEVPGDLAMSIAKQVVTEDSSITSFARKLADVIPDVKVLPFDDAARGVIRLFGSVLSTLMPKDALSKSTDTAFEWLRLGTQIEDLVKRAALTNSERLFERSLEAASVTPETASALAQLTTAMLQTLPLLQNKAEANDIDDPEMGEIIDALRVGTDVLTAPAHLANELVSSPEVGDFFLKLKKFAKKAATGLGKVGEVAGKVGGGIAGSMIGMPTLGAQVGGALGGLPGRLSHKRPSHARATSAPSTARNDVRRAKDTADRLGIDHSRGLSTEKMGDILRHMAQSA